VHGAGGGVCATARAVTTHDATRAATMTAS
jgi:spermidine synthase